MPRAITTNLQSKLSIKRGTKPITILRINWASGTKYYAGEIYDFIATTEPRLLSLDTVASQITSDIGRISTVSVELSDYDNALKILIDKEIIEGRPCAIYHWYTDLSINDATVIMKGILTSDITWNEGERILRFNIESLIGEGQLGYAPEKDDFANMREEAIGKPWPLVFGCARYVPAAFIRGPMYGTLAEDAFHGVTSFVVTGGEKFPQETAIQIDLISDNHIIRCSGSFKGNVFTPTSTNDTFYINKGIDPRPSGAVDKDTYNASVLWVDDEDTDLVKKFVWIEWSGTVDLVNFCYKQIGKKCWFQRDWMYINDNIRYQIPSSKTIKEVRGAIPSGWPNTYRWFDSILDFSTPASLPVDLAHSARFVISPDSWIMRSGTVVREVTTYNNQYVANLIPSTSIKEVFAFREYQGEKDFSPIPSSYFSIDYNYNIAGKVVTKLEFDKKLDDYHYEKWETDIYVTVQSSVGPNVSDIIKYLIVNYSNLSVDNDSFNTVQAKIAAYPANFAFLDVRDTLEACQRIAYEARCALFLRNGVVYIKYLSEIPSDITQELHAGNTGDKSIELGFLSREDLITHYEAKYKTDYSGQEHSEDTFVAAHNVSVLGEHKCEEEWLIYPQLELIQKSVGFWLYRHANIWKTIAGRHFLDSLQLDVFDDARYVLDALSLNAIRGLVEQFGYDAVEKLFTIKSLLSSRCGLIDAQDQPIEDTSFWTGDPNYPISSSDIAPDSPCAGLALVDYTVFTEDEEEEATQFPGVQVGTPPDPEPQFNWWSCPLNVQDGDSFLVEIHIINKDNNLILTTLQGLFELQHDGAATSDYVLTPLSFWFKDGKAQVTCTIVANVTPPARGQIICKDDSTNPTISSVSSPMFDITV